MDAFQVSKTVPIGTVATESQARELKSVPTEKREAVIGKAVDSFSNVFLYWAEEIVKNPENVRKKMSSK